LDTDDSRERPNPAVDDIVPDTVIAARNSPFEDLDYILALEARFYPERDAAPRPIAIPIMESEWVAIGGGFCCCMPYGKPY
jgi:hypothetical protein